MNTLNNYTNLPSNKTLLENREIIELISIMIDYFSTNIYGSGNQRNLTFSKKIKIQPPVIMIHSSLFEGYVLNRLRKYLVPIRSVILLKTIKESINLKMKVNSVAILHNEESN